MSDNGSPLDPFIDHVVRGHTASAIAALGATDSPARCDWACNEMIWPALEVVQDLAAARQLPRATYNAAIKVLSAAADRALRDAPANSVHGRSVLVLTVPGEHEELGAALIARLAETHGWSVHFAGAGVSHEEIMFALGRLTPEAVMVHGGLRDSAPAMTLLVNQFQRVGVWPITQIAACGRGVERLPSNGKSAQPDLIGRTPIELLELMQLCPDYRTKAYQGGMEAVECSAASPATSPAALSMLRPAGEAIFPEAIRRRLAGRYDGGESN